MSTLRTNNRSHDDQCFADQQNVDSAAPGNYQLNPMAQRNSRQVNDQLGCMTFSQMRDYMTDDISSRVDIESDLRGQNFKLSECHNDKHKPVKSSMLNDKDLPPTLFRVVELESTRPSNIGHTGGEFSTCISNKN